MSGPREVGDTPRPENELLQLAWGVIANAGWDGQERSPGWQEAAERWRDSYHAFLEESEAAGE